MAGLNFDMGIGTSAMPGMYSGLAVTPAAAGASPQGPTTIGQKAFGIVTGGGGVPKTSGVALVSSGTLALGLLIFIWWSLPRLGGTDMRFTIPGVLLGIALYWGFQHFTGMGNTGKAKAAA